MAYATTKAWTDVISRDQFNIIKNFLREKQYMNPSEIQCSILPEAIKDKNVFFQGKNGAGKTLCFLIPSVLQIDFDKDYGQVIIISNNVENSMQVEQDYLQKLNDICFKDKNFFVRIDPRHLESFDSEYKKQKLIASTPNFIKRMNEGKLKGLENVSLVVIDEADTVVSSADVCDALKSLVKKIGDKARFMFVSATVNGKIDEVWKLVKERKGEDSYFESLLKKDETNSTNMHYVIEVTDGEEKIEIVKSILSSTTDNKAFIFMNTKVYSDKLKRILDKNNLVASIYHKGIRPEERDENFKKFKENKVKVMICTDVLAKGIDIPECDIVVNFDVPKTMNSSGIDEAIDTYKHRQGRCSRFGRKGFVFNFVRKGNDEDQSLIKNLKERCKDFKPFEVIKSTDIAERVRAGK